MAFDWELLSVGHWGDVLDMRYYSAGTCLAGLISLVSGCQLFLVSSLEAEPKELARGLGWRWIFPSVCFMTIHPLWPCKRKAHIPRGFLRLCPVWGLLLTHGGQDWTVKGTLMKWLHQVTRVLSFVSQRPQMSEFCEARVRMIGRYRRLKPSSEMACLYTLQRMTCVQAFLLCSHSNKLL